MQLLSRLKKDYPNLSFEAASTFYWSPSRQTVFYKQKSQPTMTDEWSILHELAHAKLNHNNYYSDFELVKLELDAWQEAKEIAKNYGIKIDSEHIEDCLDTYRDWLHQRATCPTCQTVSTQRDPNTYQCFNCRTSWHVSNSRFCRPYRKVV